MKCLSKLRECDIEVKIMFLFTCSSKSKKTISLGLGLRQKHIIYFFLNDILTILALRGIAS